MNTQQGSVLWFIGLSGAGKTTTARHVASKLVQQGRRVEILDGDELRQTICKGLGFSREERFENIRRIAYVSKLLARNGVDVIVSAITPYSEMREFNRSELPGYVEVYVKCSLSECERRDVKGLYAKARSGELKYFTGISDPFDEPESPDITICTSSYSIEENSGIIETWLNNKRRVLNAAP